MTDPHRPLPLRDVLDIVERRRRRRARAASIGGTALAVGAAGVAGVIVVVLQNGPSAVVPAAPPSALVPADPTIPPATVLPPPVAPTTTGPPPAAAASTTVPDVFAPYARPTFVEDLALGIIDQPDIGGTVDRATEMEASWGIPYYPDAKAVVIKADLTGTRFDPTDPAGDDRLISRFEQAGYTAADADALAEAWGTSRHTAEVLGALVLAAEG